MGVKLTDLEPRWFVHTNTGVTGMSFLCPHCRKTRLAVQFHHTAPAAMKSDPSLHHTLDTFIWQITGDAPSFGEETHGGFEHVSLTPSVDASKLGHWHGWIIGGEVR